MFIELKSLIPQFFNSSDWKIKLLSLWPTIIGTAHTKIRIEKIQQTTVIFGVSDTHWLHELHALSRTLILQINKHLNGNYVTNVRFKYTAEHNEIKFNAQPNEQQNNNAQFILTDPQIHALNKIHDEELRNVLKKFLKQRIKQ